MSNDPANLDPSGAAPPDPDAVHFAKVTAGVYRSADPEVVWKAIQYAIRHKLPSENPIIALMFVRIAETFPEVADYLNEVKSKASETEQSALKLILDPPAEIQNGAYLPEKVESPGELDLCWSEFLVTGDIATIEKVVAVLDEPDHTRRFLNEVLTGKSTAADSESGERLELTEEDRDQLAGVGIVIGRQEDGGAFQVLSPGDLDLLMWIGLKTKIATCTRIVRSMGESLVTRMATKGAALWSLQSNAGQHGTVRLLCIEAAKQPGGFGRSLLNVQ